MTADVGAQLPVAEPVEALAELPLSERRWYPVVTALLVAFGGYLVPVVGWIVGIVMMWLAKSWYGWEKWAATLFPAVLAAVVLVGLTIAGSFGSGLTSWHLMILLVLATPAVAGLWLLWRLSRHPRPAHP